MRSLSPQQLSLSVLCILAMPSLLSLSCAPDPDLAPAPPRPAAIAGGAETNYDTWQAAVMVVSHNILCSGTLIHPQVVLTAGHCLRLMENGSLVYDYSESPSRIAVYGGPTGEDRLAGVTEAVVHPDWDGTVDFESADLAMLRLDRALESLEPIRLRDFPGPAVNDPAVLVGYGEDESGLSAVHRAGEAAILAVDTHFIENGGDANTCSGDSGGPLLTQQDGEWVLTGVTSVGAEQCALDSPGYAVNLLSHCAWLNETLLAQAGEDLGLERCTVCRAAPAETWGGPCGPGYPCCPQGAACRRPTDFSDNDLGYCAPACCAPESDDPLCSDVADGVESCLFMTELGVAYCAIECGDDGDCPTGTACKNRPFESQRICIADAPGDGPAVECDTEDSTTDNGAQDTEILPSDGDAGEDDDGIGDGCGCRAAGGRAGLSRAMAWLARLVKFTPSRQPQGKNG